MLTIEEPYKGKTAFLQLGFRPFFTAAMSFAVFSIAVWMLIYLLGWSLPVRQYASMTWHAHEMIFGYGMAVAAGFLLTAIRNWTGIQTLQNKLLLVLFVLWLVARGLPFVLPYSLYWLLAVTDLSFTLFLVLATSLPIIKARQWNNVAFPGKMLLMLVANTLFYFGLLGVWPMGLHIGLYAGFYTLVALIFTMGRRIIPFFIEKGVDESFTPKNRKWLDISNLVLFLLFAVVDIFYPTSTVALLLAGLLFLLNGLRLYDWYTHGIWQKPLLWSLYLGYVWLVFGFLLKLLSLVFSISPFLAIHSFAYGGIGLITVGMMTRVALGHTGRNVFDPPRILPWVYGLLLMGAFVRVVLPLLDMQLYTVWIGLAQGLWIVAFLILSIVYMPMLIKPRVDGRPG